jgi:UDP-N-acetylmuramyl pentapeptide phosphotransferase/UDP-N-acetylglucosamine-1-phosphate transferase
VSNLLTVILAFAAAAWGTRELIGWLAARQFVAVENNRTMHAGAIPQGGGIAVVPAVLAPALLLWPWTWTAVTLAAVVAALAAMSAANDRRDIPIQWRLSAHVAAAGVALALIPGSTLIFGGAVPFLLDRLVALLAFAWFINLYNFMDGIDGITGIETISIAAGVLAVSATAAAPDPNTGLALALIGAPAGFLVWNWHRARIFLGDVGSIPLGFLTGALLLHLAATTSLAAAIILPLYYLTDATLTLLRRFWAGEKVWQAHRSHAYQRAARAAGAHDKVVLRIAAANAVLVVAAVLAVRQPLAGLALAVAIVALLMWRLEQLAGTPPADVSRGLG